MDSASQSLSIKTEILLLIITTISLIILNISTLKQTIAGTIASLIIIFITGYGVTLLLPLPRKEETSNLIKIFLSIIIGIVLIGLWGFLTSYAHINSLNSTFQYLTIIIVTLVFVIKLVKKLKGGKNEIKEDNGKWEKESRFKIKNRKEAKLLKTARKAAQLEKDKVSSISRKPIPLAKKKDDRVIKLNQSSKDLLVILLVTLLSSFLILGPFLKDSVIKTPFCIALLFFIPGYALLACVFKKFKEYSRKKKVIGSILVSTALFLGIGALRYLTHLKISSKTILGILIGLSLLFIVLSYLRRIKIQKTLKKSFRGEVLDSENSWDDLNDSKKSGQPYSIVPSVHKTASREVEDITPQKKNKSLIWLYLVVLVFGFLGLILSWVPSVANTWIRAVFMVPLIFILPGYVLKELILSSKFTSKKSTILISIFLSILISIMIGSLFGVIYPSQQGYHNICTTILSVITIIGILGVLWINRRKYKSYPPSLSPKDYPDRTHELTDELKQYSKEKKSFKLKKDPEKVESNDTTREVKKLKRKDEFSKTQHLEEDLKKSFSQVYPEKKSFTPESSSRLSFLKNDIFLVILTTLITLTTIYVPFLSATPLREIFGLLFVLFIPGYVLTAALFPKKSSVDGIERLALSFGLSLAISPLIGGILYFTKSSVEFTSLILPLTALTIILCVIVLVRRRRLDEDERYAPNLSPYFHSIKASFQQESRLDKILSIVLIICLILAVASTVYIIVKPKEGEKFTEFYILGPGGKASDYPTNLTVGQNGSVILGVVNHEYANISYRYLVSLNGTNITSEVINLKPGEKWEKSIQFAPTIAGADKKLEFILYKLPDETTAYRSLHLWVDVSE
ncbi:DUF1616 domain-containing protein [Methanobacterium alcaliphilum]|uniref:DUF1616 domain-containing protein n=1 Tax=Methanobacterium alcaliphilum TaxID=392018 RepID=UPI00200A2FA2|nr:DUF1616 domain-containing protein [Methanobacterium alcaliphilum]MCK9150746.1 DUF1616 domain-containing protein [Methanobacterium alcaliphilum]